MVDSIGDGELASISWTASCSDSLVFDKSASALDEGASVSGTDSNGIDERSTEEEDSSSGSKSSSLLLTSEVFPDSDSTIASIGSYVKVVGDVVSCSGKENSCSIANSLLPSTAGTSLTSICIDL